MNRIDKIKECLENMDTFDVIPIHNEVMDADEWVYQMWEFDDVFCDAAPLTIAALVRKGTFNENDSYFYQTIYGIKSFDYADDLESPVDFDYLAQYIDRNEKDFGCDELREILDELED